MKTVKTFANLPEAGFASSLLQASGILALLTDEQSFPMTPGMATGGIRLQVEDQDFARAVRVLEEGPDAQTVPTAPVSSEKPVNAGRIPIGVFAAFFAGLVLLGFAGHLIREKRRQTYDVDFNHDGKPDHFYTYRGGTISKVEVDRNFDGKFDEWQFYDREGRIERVELDQDFNGQPDWFGFFENGILVRIDCRPNGSKIVVRRQIYEHGVLREEWVDENQTGTFNYKILFDPFGGRSERIPIPPAN